MSLSFVIVPIRAAFQAASHSLNCESTVVRCRILAACLVAVLVLFGAIVVAEEKSSNDVALMFWNAFLDGNADEMGKHYAHRVTLKAGSELLKSEYAINESGQRDKDLAVDRKQVIHGYRTMFNKVGKAKWIESGKKLRNAQVTCISAADNNKYFAMFKASAGEILVQIHTDPEPIFFLLQQDEHHRWVVVAEAFD